MSKKVAVVAIGGNSLIKDEKHKTVEDQYQAAKETTCHIADMIEAGLGCGHRSWQRSAGGIHPAPVRDCRESGRHARSTAGCVRRGQPGCDRVRVAADPAKRTLPHEASRRQSQPWSPRCWWTRTIQAFKNPTKPIGGFMDEAEAKRREKELGWSVVEDAGRGWRRVVASPLPKEVVELESVETLIKAGTVVITVGGGGIPVIDKAKANMPERRQSSTRILPPACWHA